MTAQTRGNSRQPVDRAQPPRRDLLAWTAIGRARGRYRTYLVATCTALVPAAVGDEATGYDGPGPFIDLGLAVLVAVLWWRYSPVLIVAGSTFFLVGGFVTPGFAPRLVEPDQFLDFASGWLQMLSFAAAAVFAVLAVVYARRAARYQGIDHV
ncbi:MAG: hypothetical protein QOH84_4255 [Kribbellaceae bacterium]|nr:hypothetical protein [Kribbellaceae bacterium]